MKRYRLGGRLQGFSAGALLGVVACLPLVVSGCTDGALRASAASPKVPSFTLVDADTDQPIAAFDPIVPGAPLDLTALPSRRVNLRANTSPARVGSVRFTLDRSHYVEDTPPYALASHTEGITTCGHLPQGVTR